MNFLHILTGTNDATESSKKGDLPGHQFHGNQYTNVLGGSESKEAKHDLSNLPLKVSDAVAATTEARQLPKQLEVTKENLYHEAEQANQDLKKWLNDGNGVANQIGFKTSEKSPGQMTPEDWKKPGALLFLAPLKGEDRATEKVNNDYKGDWSRLKDVVRCTLAADTIGQLKEAMSKMMDSGMVLAANPKNKLANPTNVGYRDVNIVVRMPNGVLAEIQFNVKSMMAAKDEAHPYYEKTSELSRKHADDKGNHTPSKTWNSPEDRAAYREAKSKQQGIYRKAWNDHLNSY